MSKKIVAFGGGSAIPRLILKPLREMGFEMVGITSMVDNGGSTGALRRELNVLPPGDIRRHLMALANFSPEEEWKEKIWNFRFARNIELSPGHFGHNFANVLIAALEKNYGFERALDILHDFLHVKGKAFPATLDKVQLIAELEDGEFVEGEDEIDVGENHNRTKKIKRVFLKPEAEGYKKAIEEIEKADVIIAGPGDLYSSIIPCFLPKGIKEAIMSSKAKKVFICPLMTKLGETQGFSVMDFTREVERYIGCELDYVVFNNLIPPKDKIEKVKNEGEFLIDLVFFDNVPKEKKFIGENLFSEEEAGKHDKEKLTNLLVGLIEQS